MASRSSNLRLKLLIDTQQEKVLFAEASKEVIDFLFSLLCLPLSTVITVLSKKTMVGCISNLYQSVENLDVTYMQPNKNKDLLLKPRLPVSSPQISALLLPANGGYSDDKAYNGGVHGLQPLGFQAFGSIVGSESGFVREVVTYMVMDDLVVQPMSTISSITLLNSFNVKEIGALQEKVVPLGMSQGIELLKASLQSKNVLTSVFLNNT